MRIGKGGVGSRGLHKSTYTEISATKHWAKAKVEVDVLFCKNKKEILTFY